MWLYNVQLCPHNATAAPHLVFGRCPTIFGCSLNIAWYYFHLGLIQVRTLPISEHLYGHIVKIRYSRCGHPKQNFRQAHIPGSCIFLGGGPADILPFRQDTDQSVPSASIVSSLQFDNPCLAGRVWTALHCGSHAAAACTAGVAHNTLHSRTPRGVGHGK